MDRVTALRRLAGESGGFTLIELLMASVVGLVVVGVGVMVFTVSLGSQARVDSAAASIQDARTTMERMVRELREGSGLVPGTTATASSISVVTYVDSTCSGTPSSSANRCSVTYSCSGGICTRRVAQADGTSPGSAVQVIKGLSSSSIFSYSPSAASPQYIAIRLALPTTTGGNAITLTDGAALRNWGL